MHAKILLLTSGLIAFVHAQEQCSSLVAQVPSCAVQCIQSAAPAAGCDTDDFVCACQPEKMAMINTAAIGCVLKGCGPQTGIAAQASASAVCDCAASAGSGAETTGSMTVPMGPGPVQVTTGSMAVRTGTATGASASGSGSMAVTMAGTASSTAAAAGASTSNAAVRGSGSGAETAVWMSAVIGIVSILAATSLGAAVIGSL